jgi:Asp-tRNA(Asn)/Glu-tRNA(Gln) amidotransferase A subunit family amidase
MSAASLGSDLVGSIRIPAHFCGVVGLKPTAGRIEGAGHCPPMEGAFALAASLGPLARRVDDVALLYGVLAGGHASFEFEKGATGTRGEIDLRGRRVGVYTDDGVAKVTEEMRGAVEAAARALAEAGLVVSQDERPPGVEHGARLWRELFAPATQVFLRSMFEGRESEGGEAVRLILEHGRSAPHVGLEEYFRAWTERDERRARLVEWMMKTPLLVAPVGAVAAFEHGARKVSAGGETSSVFRAFSYSQTFNVYDLPAISIPAGRTREGLPIGVQIIGRPFAEREVLAAARIVEEALGGWLAPVALEGSGEVGSLSNGNRNRI